MKPSSTPHITTNTTHLNKQCNCRDKESCPDKAAVYKKMKPSSTPHILTNNATVGIKNHAPTRQLSTKNVYWVTIKTKNSVKKYIGATEGTLKQRIYSHKLSFPTEVTQPMSLSTHIWHLKDMSILPTITLEILKLAPAYSKT